MGFRDRMKNKKGNLRKRHIQQVRNSGNGGRFPTIFIKDAIPEGVEFYQCNEREHIVDILPWEVGSDMPFDEYNQPITEKGDPDYVLDIWVHQNVGAMKKPFVCPYENFGLPCPICEYVKSKRLPKEEYGQLRPKRRVVYLIWAHTDMKEEKKGIQIFEASHFLMEEKIADQAKLPKGGGAIEFSHYENGKNVVWERKGSGRENTRYTGHKLLDREMPIPDSILDATFPLDSVVHMHPSYEEIEKEFRGMVVEDEPVEDANNEEDTPFGRKPKDYTDEGDIDDTKLGRGEMPQTPPKRQRPPVQSKPVENQPRQRRRVRRPRTRS